VRLDVTNNEILKQRSLRQQAAAKLLRLHPPKIPALANYRLDGFSVPRLPPFLDALGRGFENRDSPEGSCQAARNCYRGLRKPTVSPSSGDFAVKTCG
jgi:predicted XRE-type DNA-binding protein